MAPPERFEMPPEGHDLRGYTCDLRGPDGVCNHHRKRGPEQMGIP